MKRIIFFTLYIILLLITGCSSVNLANTVAGGKNGAVNYCIRVLGNEAFCVEGKRTGDQEETPQQTSPQP